MSTRPTRKPAATRTSKPASKAASKRAAKRAPKKGASRRDQNPIEGLTDSAFHRLFRRAGTKRVQANAWKYLREYAGQVTQMLVEKSAIVAEYAGHKTLGNSHLFAVAESMGLHLAAGLDNAGRLPHFHGVHKKQHTEEKSSSGKTHRFRPGTVALRDIRKQQKNSDNLIFQAQPYRRLVKSYKPADVRVSQSFVDLLQFTVEQKLLTIAYDAQLTSLHARRVGVEESDIRIAIEIGGREVE